MKKGIIITLPRHDDVTEYLSVFSKEILEIAESNNILCRKLFDKEANKENFERVINKTNHKLIVFNGHGTENSICGYADEPIVKEKANEQILSDKITYARTCDSASSLGHASMQNNKGGCFIGYSLPFQFYCDETWKGNPAKDPVAPLFLEPSNLIPISIIKGRTTSEAHFSSKKAILKNMKKALRRADSDSLAIAEALWNNYYGQTLIGNKKAEL